MMAAAGDLDLGGLRGTLRRDECLGRHTVWGIGGPADRFYEIQTELRKVMERGVEENTLEMALRGRPRKPFYMVGRMGDQSLVIRAEKGKVKMTLDGEEEHGQEIVYDLKKESEDGKEERQGEGCGEGREEGAQRRGEAAPSGSRRAAASAQTAAYQPRF